MDAGKPKHIESTTVRRRSVSHSAAAIFNASSSAHAPKKQMGVGSSGATPEDELLKPVLSISETRKKLYFAVFLAILVVILGSVTYEQIEGWDWLTSLYFMSATMTTIGYGDVYPKTELGRLVTVFFMWTGVSIGLYLIYTISEFREKEVDEHLRTFMGRIRTQGKKIRI